MKVYDCFNFFNELDMLEIRLRTMWDIVNIFVLGECTLTQSKLKKPLFYKENKELFSEFNSKIRHIEIPARDLPHLPLPGTWEQEYFQHDYLYTGLFDAEPDDLIIISDVDEIIDPEVWPEVLKSKTYPVSLTHDVYRHYINAWSELQKNALILPFKILQQIPSINYFRRDKDRYPTIFGGGWHFTTMGTPENIKIKMLASAHTDLMDHAKESDIKRALTNLTNIYDSSQKLKLVDIAQERYPKCINDIIKKYPYLLYRKELINGK
jgi:beta-1,4-mannosyl-glycoprotein beta-1,4-N-acetylglucosaminyltransferase